jgi:putative transposase
MAPARPLVQAITGCPACKKMLNIELNPVRAGMVGQPSDYAWSSYSINALGKESELCRPHSLFIALGGEPKERQ